MVKNKSLEQAENLLHELGRYATKSMALIGIAEYIAARDRVGTTYYYTADDIRNSVYVPQPPDGDR